MENKKGITKRYFYIGLTAFVVIAACVLFFFVLFKLPSIYLYVRKIISVLQPVIFGLIITYLVNPIANSINGLSKKLLSRYFKNKSFVIKVSNAVSVLGSLIIFILAIFFIFYLVVPEFIESISSLITVLPGQMDALINWVTNLLKENEALENFMVQAINYEKNWLQNDLAGYVNQWAGYFANGIWSVVTFLKNFALGLIFALYILFNKKLFIKQTRKLLFSVMNNKTVQYILDTGKKSHKIFSGFIYGKLLDSLIIGVLCFIGISILKIPYTMLVAVTIGVTNVIPVFGPYLGAIPCAALILLASPIKGLYFIIFIILLQTLDGNFIGPKILGNSTGLSAFWVVFAIVIGGGMFGILGMLIGVPTFAVIYYIVSSLVNLSLSKKKMPLDSNYYDKNICEKIKNQGDDLQLEIDLGDDQNQK